MEEKEISNEDVKKQFEELSNKGVAETSEETSTEETEADSSSSEDVKSVKSEETSEESEDADDPSSPVVPRTRLNKEIERRKELEELAEQAKDFIVKDPVTGKLTLKQVDSPKKEVEEDKGLELTEEEQLALDSVQLSTIKKVIAHEYKVQQREQQLQQSYRQDTDKWWNKTKEDFPELAGKDFQKTPLYQRALKILKEQHVVMSKDGKNFYIPPNAQYLSTIQAEKELAREKVKTTQSKIEEKKQQKNQIFIEKKSVSQQQKKKPDEKEFETLSPTEQEDAIREQMAESQSEE